jgi:hypothetical protein
MKNLTVQASVYACQFDWLYSSQLLFFCEAQVGKGGAKEISVTD